MCRAALAVATVLVAGGAEVVRATLRSQGRLMDGPGDVARLRGVAQRLRSRAVRVRVPEDVEQATRAANRTITALDVVMKARGASLPFPAP